jgi:hypothetical protein
MNTMTKYAERLLGSHAAVLALGPYISLRLSSDFSVFLSLVKHVFKKEKFSRGENLFFILRR